MESSQLSALMALLLTFLAPGEGRWVRSFTHPRLAAGQRHTLFLKAEGPIFRASANCSRVTVVRAQQAAQLIRLQSILAALS